MSQPSNKNSKRADETARRVVASVRLQPALLEAFEASGIPLAPFVESAIEDFLGRKTCPTCGQLVQGPDATRRKTK